MISNLKHKLVIPTIFCYVFFSFIVISTVVSLILSQQYFENVIIAVSNLLNLSLSSMFLGLMAKQKWKHNVSQTSYLWLMMIGIKLISMPLFSILFSQYFINSFANLICGIFLTKELLNSRYFIRVIFTSAPLGIIIAFIVKWLIPNEQQYEYSDFLSQSFGEIISCCLQLLAILFLTFYKQIENRIKINTIRNFSNIMAHEIFIPIAVIETQIGVLKNQYLDRNTQEVLKLLTQNCRKIRKRINFVMQNTRLIGSRPVFTQVGVSVREVIQDCIDEYKGDKLDIILTDHNDISFPGPKNVLQCVIYNIIDNAFQHGGLTNNIEIIISENYVICQDSGHGIKQSFIGNIFDIFTSTKEHHLGIGLTVCKDIMTNYGGAIKCISLEGHHTTFIIKFPKQCLASVVNAI